MSWIIQLGPDQESFYDEEEAIENAMEWSVESNGDTVTVYQCLNGKMMPCYEIFA